LAAFDLDLRSFTLGAISWQEIADKLNSTDQILMQFYMVVHLGWCYDFL